MNIGNFLVIQNMAKVLILKTSPHVLNFLLFKVGHLALVEDDTIARVLSWQLIGDMDCLIVNNMRKVSCSPSKTKSKNPRLR